MSHRVSRGSALISYAEHNGWTYEFPFLFIIPPMTRSFSHDIPAACRVLPPSLQSGKCPAPFTTTRTCPRLAIQYELRVSVDYRECSSDQLASPKQVIGSREIHIVPYTEACPPTETRDFPGEFIMKVTVPLRSRPFRNQVGIATVVIHEPDPLVYTLETPQPETECQVDILVEGTQILLKRLQNLTICAKSGIRAKSFYSERPIKCLPIQADLADGSALRLQDEISKLRRRKFRNLSWIPYDKPPAQFGERVITFQIGAISEPISPVRFPVSASSELQASGKWLASFRLPIAPRESLPPSFCGTLVARSYSFLARLVLEGFISGTVDLEAPFQVIYPFQRQLSNHSCGPDSDRDFFYHASVSSGYNDMPWRTTPQSTGSHD